MQVLGTELWSFGRVGNTVNLSHLSSPDSLSFHRCHLHYCSSSLLPLPPLPSSPSSSSFSFPIFSTILLHSILLYAFKLSRLFYFFLGHYLFCLLDLTPHLDSKFLRDISFFYFKVFLELFNLLMALSVYGLYTVYAVCS